MSSTAPVRAGRPKRAVDLGLGETVRLGGLSGLVARVVRSREDVMVEVWNRGGVEHQAHFLRPDELVETEVVR